jgi:hypothetical protein
LDAVFNKKTAILAFVLFGLVVCSPGFTAQPECPSRFASLAKKTLYHSVALPSRAAYHVGKSLFYPVAGPVDIAARTLHHYLRNGSKGLALLPLKRLLKDLPHSTVFAILWIAGAGTGVGVNDLEMAAEAELGAPPPGIVVLVEGFTDPSDIFSRVDIVGSSALRYPGAFVVRPLDSEDLINQLKSLSEKEGPIAKLEYWEHGSPGNTSKLGPVAIWAEEVLRKGTISVNDQEWGKNRELDPKGIFAKDAQVVFLSCSLGSGLSGSRFCDDFHSAMLVPNGGGKSASARVTVFSNYPDLLAASLGLAPAPQWIRRVSEATSKPATFLTQWSEGVTSNDKYPLTDLPWTANSVKFTQSSPHYQKLRAELSQWNETKLQPLKDRYSKLFRSRFPAEEVAKFQDDLRVAINEMAAELKQTFESERLKLLEQPDSQNLSLELEQIRQASASRLIEEVRFIAERLRP